MAFALAATPEATNMVEGKQFSAAAAALPSATWTEIDGGQQTIVPLRSAPFPHGDKHWSDASVLIFVPEGAAQQHDLDLVVHFHGFTSKVADVVPMYQLTQQVAASGRDVVLVVPQGPVMARDGDFGKLMEPDGLKRLLTDVLAVLQRDGKATSQSLGDITLSAHSGGYRAVARGVAQGGVPVSTVWLFDALYGELDVFEAHIASGGKLLSTHTPKGGTRSRNDQLLERLKAAGIAVVTDVREASAQVMIAPAPVELNHSTCLQAGGMSTWLGTRD
jgi:hypothetical protein